MRRFFSPTNTLPSSNASNDTTQASLPQCQQRLREEFNPNEIISDPALRKQIDEYAPSTQDQVRRAYISKGPTQPTGLIFPRKQYGRNSRSFQELWYTKFDWLEYSESRDAAFCFHCFLFKQSMSGGKFGFDVFTKIGYDNWKNAYKGLADHVGGVNSAHNRARLHFDDYRNQRQSISTAMSNISHEAEELYKIRLTSSLDCAKYLLMQGLAFRGHDESSSSLNKGNFLEMVDWYKSRKEEVMNAYERAPRTCVMTSPKIQKDLARCCSQEITEEIIADIGDGYFSILIDESRDVSVKEQMAVILRFVNKKGQVVERFLALKHVSETTSDALKDSLLGLLDHHGLSISKLRGQGYDGASNMRGEYNGLQRKILDLNPYAFYIHCFAHQLQLVVVSVASSSCCQSVHDFFEYVSLIVSTTSSSCKRRDALKEKHRKEILDKIESGGIFSGKGLHQESNLARPGDTRWGSHYITLVRLETMWDSVLHVLSMVHEDSRVPTQAAGLIEKMETFKFVFIMKLMFKLLAITNSLSQVLQRKDVDIVVAMELLEDAKTILQMMRIDNGWETFLETVTGFCISKSIPVVDMNEEVPIRGRSRRDGFTVTNLHYYRAQIFFVVIDKIIAELSRRFNEVSNELLICVSCLDPKNLFAKFDRQKLVRLAEIYDGNFSNADRALLSEELEIYILHVKRHASFATCQDIAALSMKMVETGKNEVFPLVYKLIVLALLLPVSTVTVERAFSAMNIIKTELRNKIANDWMNDLMVCYTEREIFKSLDDEKLIRRFQCLKTRKIQLPRSTPS